MSTALLTNQGDGDERQSQEVCPVRFALNGDQVDFAQLLPDSRTTDRPFHPLDEQVKAGPHRAFRNCVTTLALVPLVLVVAAGAFVNVSIYLVAACAAVLADQLVRLASRNGQPGGSERRLPGRRSLPRQTAERRSGLTLVLVGKHSLPEGGEVLVYELGAGQPGARTRQMDPSGLYSPNISLLSL